LTGKGFGFRCRSPAAATGFVVWEGTWLARRLMARGGALRAAMEGKRVVELGAGVGLAGLCAAAMGAHVLQTDLPSVVAGSLRPNIARNASAATTDEGAPAGSPWPGAVRVGRGSAVAASIDWRKALARPECEQAAGEADPTQVARSALSLTCGHALALTRCPHTRCPTRRAGTVMPMTTSPLSDTRGPSQPLRKAEFILCVESIWLAELIEPFVATVCAIMAGPHRPECFFINGEPWPPASQSSQLPREAGASVSGYHLSLSRSTSPLAAR
jgi:hypothetical protein